MKSISFLFWWAIFLWATGLARTPVGENDHGIYFGPSDPRTSSSLLVGHYVFSDDDYRSNYLFDLSDNSIRSQQKLWHNKILPQEQCPSTYLEQHEAYIRYLFRLLSISYSFEAINQYYVDLFQFGVTTNKCQVSWDLHLKKCLPSGAEMKKFISRINFSVLDIDRQQLISKDSGEKLSWINQLTSAYKKNVASEISFSRIISWCNFHGRNECRNFDEKKVIAILENACEEDLAFILKACNEQDSLQGLSKIYIARQILANSNVATIINNDGHAYQCLERFAYEWKNLEVEYYPLSTLFDSVSKNQKNKNYGPLTGQLFAPGALKEFDDRGLTDFLMPPTPAARAISPIPTPRPSPTPLVAYKAPPKSTPTPLATAPALPTPTPRISAIVSALNKLKEDKIDCIDIDMNKFKTDYVFSSEVLAKIKEPLIKYQTRVALEDMRKFDKLGSSIEPINIIFIKFLIDNNIHQGLYNITSVIGSKFYIKNTIDKDNSPIYIELKNDETTQYHWQITILRPPVTTND